MQAGFNYINSLPQYVAEPMKMYSDGTMRNLTSNVNLYRRYMNTYQDIRSAWEIINR